MLNIEESRTGVLADSSSNTFGERLIEALIYLGITDPELQLEKVAQVCQITHKTARKYLQAASYPLFFDRYPLRFFALTEYLGVAGGWLFHGGMTFEEMRCIETFRSMTKWERTKVFRYAVRLMNNCPKARRLTAMENAGQISRRQLLAAM